MGGCKGEHKAQPLEERRRGGGSRGGDRGAKQCQDEQLPQRELEKRGSGVDWECVAYPSRLI